MVRINKTVVATACAAVCALAAWPVQAQENMLHGLGWVMEGNPGSSIRSSAITVSGNRSAAKVEAVGLGGSLGFGLAGVLRLIATAQVNTIGLEAMDVGQSQLLVSGNRLSGPMTTLGGAASANSILISGQGERKRLQGSQVTVAGNEAGDVHAQGAELYALLGSASMQIPGRASANSVLLQSTDVENSEISNTQQRAQGVRSVGGSALANVLTASQSGLQQVRIQQHGNVASEVLASGASAALGYGALAQAKLEGAALANSIALAQTQLSHSRLHQQGNEARQIVGAGGGAMANSMALTQMDGQVRNWHAVQQGNVAQRVGAFGGEGSVLMGALASVDNHASALANSINLDRTRLAGRNEHTQTGNDAQDVQARGGVALANSVWALQAQLDASSLTQQDNSAQQVRTNGGSVSALGGALGAAERSSRAGANSVVLADQAALKNMQVLQQGNQARGLDVRGGQAMANSVLADQQASLQDGQVLIEHNQAQELSTQGSQEQLAGGLLWKAQQDAVVLANSLAVVGSQWRSPQLALQANTAGQLHADGGSITANSVSLERGDGAGSALHAPVWLKGNTAIEVQTQAESSSTAISSSHTRARAALNAVLLHDNSSVDADSQLQIAGNRAELVSGMGGTALVQSLAAYRGASLARTPVTIENNRAQGIHARGDHQQTLGYGSSRHGIAAVNSVYLEGQQGAGLKDSHVQVQANRAEEMHADGALVQANTLALSQRGRLLESQALVRNNQAASVSAFAQTTRGLFGVNERQSFADVNLNTLDIQAPLAASSLLVEDNRVERVDAQEGGASVNSVALGQRAQGLRALEMRVAGNQATGVRSSQGQQALAHSVTIDGTASNSRLDVVGNQAQQVHADAAGAEASSVKADGGSSVAHSSIGITGNRASIGTGGTVASVKNQQGGRIAQSRITIANNQASASQGGVNASVINSGSLGNAAITISGNRGSAANAALANSVRNRHGRLGGQIAILNNRGQAAAGGVLNSVDNSGGSLSGSVTIVGNQGQASGNALANSVHNSGSMNGRIVLAANKANASSSGVANAVKNQGQLSGRVNIVGNDGTASTSGTVNSVVNNGLMAADVSIVGNRGSASMGGVSNSVVNNGLMAGRVLIAGNQSSTAGGTVNSLINHGVMTGSVNIVANRGAAAPGTTTGSVINAGALVGAAGVAANVPHVANPGYTYTVPSTGVINQSVLIAPAYNFVFQ
ncbi:hypothetical protein ABFV80_003023 [Vandammella animalimorsus]|uniref:hypothetical protein n=1 Tax=Vandammella animalimorsus TaxID=2029117 RepID=UPI00325AC350